MVEAVLTVDTVDTGKGVILLTDMFGGTPSNLSISMLREDKVEVPIGQQHIVGSIDQADSEVRFASAVAAFGQLLKGGTYTGAFSYDDVLALARNAKGADRHGYRAEFINLVELAKHAARLPALKQ